MNKLLSLLLLLVILISCNLKMKKEGLNEPEKLPNIILILADDMGYGDPGCYNDKSQILTPNIDKLAKEGIMFTNAHTNSSVCTPTRYGILTGEYAWRGQLKRGVTWSYDSLIIDTAETTIASLLKENGYHTSAVGKWHLGLGWTKSNGEVAFDKVIRPGPNELGFDYFYGISSSLDIPPYVYIKDSLVVEVPNASSEGTSKTAVDDFWRSGPVSPDFDHYDVLNHLTQEAERTIRYRSTQEQPFFLYFPLTAPHTPWIPKEKFQGTSDAGNYGDLAAEVDDVVGRIEKLLMELNLEEETLIIFTSDNGSPLKSSQMKAFNHSANGIYKGRKGDVHEGGNRVPFIVKWPGKIQEDVRTDQLVSTTDFLATFSDLVKNSKEPDQKINQKDSKSFLPYLFDTSKTKEARDQMIYHSASGMFGYRKEKWLFIQGKGDGGFIEPEDTTHVTEPYQLYNLEIDPAQKNNLYSNNQSRANDMLSELESLKN